MAMARDDGGLNTIYNWIIGIGVVIGIALWIGAANEKPEYCNVLLHDPRTGDTGDPACD
jgi:hypothetical protein